MKFQSMLAIYLLQNWCFPLMDKLSSTKSLLGKNLNVSQYWIKQKLSQVLIKNCLGIHLKSFVKHSPNDPNCYEIQNETTNVAIPHTERVPCYYDSVLYKRNSDYSPVWFGHSTEKGYGMSKIIFFL